MSNDENTYYDTGETISSESLQIEEIGFNCPLCSSLIEILSINENNNIIEFKCLNKECVKYKSMEIKSFLEKRKQNKNKFFEINRDICKEHIIKYKSFCFDCDKHLCSQCQKNEIHIEHSKNNIIEIEPNKDELKMAKAIIKYYEDEIEKMNRKKIYYIKRIKRVINIKKGEINKIKHNKINEIKERKEKELNNNRQKYFEEINKIKEKYENEIKKSKIKFELNNRIINNEYKLMEEKLNHIYSKKIVTLENKKREIANNLNLNKKIENFTNIKILHELVYNTYIEYRDNIINAINIKHIILNFNEKNIFSKNAQMRNNFKNDINAIIDLIKKKVNAFQNVSKSVFKRERKNHNYRSIRESKSQLLNKEEENKEELNKKEENKEEDKAEENKEEKKEEEKKENVNNTLKITKNIFHNIDSKKKSSEHLFFIFNNIFFNKKPNIIKSIKIDDNTKKYLEEIYNNFKKEKKEEYLLSYYENYFVNYLLAYFQKKDENRLIIDILKYNVESILECLKVDRYAFKKYYGTNSISKNNNRRKKSTESVLGFRRNYMTFSNDFNSTNAILSRFKKK